MVALPEMNERFVVQGVDLGASTPEAFASLIKAEVPRWRKMCATPARAPTDSCFPAGRELHRRQRRSGYTFRPKPCALLRRPPQ